MAQKPLQQRIPAYFLVFTFYHFMFQHYKQYQVMIQKCKNSAVTLLLLIQPPDIYAQR